MKKALTLVFALMLIASIFAGCSGKSSVEETPNATEGPKETPEVTNTEIKVEKPITIKFMHWRAEDKEAYAKIYADFKVIEPNITIEEEILPPAEYKKVLETRLSGGAGADIFGINGVNVWGPKYFEAGYLEPLNNFQEVNDTQDTFKNLTVNTNGDRYAVVWNSVNFGLFFNQELFDQAGVKKPANWAEFLDACQKLKDKGIVPIAAGGKDAHVLGWLLSYIAATDQYVKDPDGFVRVSEGKAKFSEVEGFKSTLNKFITLVDKGFLDKDTLGLGYNDSVTVFSQGKAAMVVAGAFTAPTILAANANLKLGALPVPGDNGENNTFGVAGMSYGINKSSSDDAKIAAKKFLSFMFDKKVSKEFSEKVALFTTVKGVDLNFENQAVKDFAELSNNMIIPTLIDDKVVDPTYNNQLWSDLQGLVAGTVTLDALLKNQDAKIIAK